MGEIEWNDSNVHILPLVHLQSGGASGKAKGGGIISTGSVGPDDVKDANMPQPLGARERVDGEAFGRALILFGDPFVIQVLTRTLMRKVEEVYKAKRLPKDDPVIPSLIQLLHMGLGARAQLSRVLSYRPPPPPEGPPAYSITNASMSPLVPGKDGEPTGENDLQDAVRHVLPCCKELSTYMTLSSIYDEVGWEGQPHDKDVIQVKRQKRAKAARGLMSLSCLIVLLIVCLLSSFSG